ncbi:hypothetical protein MMC14_006476 [Varicellaria rhodocarpa]|nr:hypothetical protein [Varicellaria rhodocarpa]
MDIIKAILPCFPLESSSHRTITTAANPQIPNEKQIIYRQPSTLHTDEKTALRVLSVLQTTEKSPGPALSATIDSIVHEAGGWKESIAKYVLAKLEAVIKAGEQMSPIMKKAYDWAYEEALKIIGFGKEHPVFYTVVAIGVLLFLAPYVLEVLGFGTLEAIGFGLEGPIEGLVARAFRGCGASQGLDFGFTIIISFDIDIDIDIDSRLSFSYKPIEVQTLDGHHQKLIHIRDFFVA